jgi:ribosome assembly protein 1
MNIGGEIELQSSDKRLTLSIKAVRLPLSIVKFLDENVQLIKLANKYVNKYKKVSQDSNATESFQLINEFRQRLSNEFLKYSKQKDEGDIDVDWCQVTNRILGWGPNRYGPNILVNNLEGSTPRSIWSMIGFDEKRDEDEMQSQFKDFENSFLFGFNLATSKGPLCEEPIQGVAFFIEKFHVQSNENRSDDQEEGVKDESDIVNILDKLNISNASSERKY